jgi:glycosyltransferase involved in cell wall biosynthesis
MESRHLKSKSRHNIAIIIPGGIGTGRNNIGVPVLERIIKLLSAEFNLTVFQLFKVNENFRVDGFELVDIYSTNRLLKSIKLCIAFVKIHRQKRFHTVHGFWTLPCGFLAVLIGKLFKIKSVVSVLGGDAISLPEIHYGQLQHSLNKKIILWTLHKANEVMVLTQYLIDNLKREGLRRDDIRLIPWGVDTTLFTFREKSFQDPVEFLHIANLHPVKDQETLLRAFKIISGNIRARLTIIGEGISEDYINTLILELNLQHEVSVLNLLPYELLPEYYHKADVLLHTSLSEGQCEVVTEAMSCGVLVCGTCVGLLYDLPHCGVTVPVKDYELLARKALELIQHPKDNGSMRQRARDWTLEHSIWWTVAQLKKLYEH